MSKRGMAQDRRLKPCRHCKTQWAITVLVRSDAECDLHHSYQLCREHGSLDCFDGSDGCPGSIRRRLVAA